MLVTFRPLNEAPPPDVVPGPPDEVAAPVVAAAAVLVLSDEKSPVPILYALFILIML
mgnify:CR=1 FL=1